MAISQVMQIIFIFRFDNDFEQTDAARHFQFSFVLSSLS